MRDNLNSAFSDVPKDFNVVHINAQNIPAHYPDLLACFEENNLHAILVSESFLNPRLPSTSYSLPRFYLILNDRLCSFHDGLAIYLHSFISFKILSRSSQRPTSQFDRVSFLVVTLSRVKILLGVYYSPSLRIDYFSFLEILLEDFSSSYDPSIAMSDFNTRLLKNDDRSRC